MPGPPGHGLSFCVSFSLCFRVGHFSVDNLPRIWLSTVDENYLGKTTSVLSGFVAEQVSRADPRSRGQGAEAFRWPVPAETFTDIEAFDDCEIKAAQRMIESHGDLSHTLTTADALHAQRRTAGSIVSRGGDFIVQAKDNQKTVHGLAVKLTSTSSPLLPAQRKPTAG